MFKQNYHHEYLPDINIGVQCARLCFGSLVRLALFHGARHAYKYLSCKFWKKKDEQKLHKSERAQLCQILSTGVQIGASVLLMPTRYLVAINTPRFFLSFLLTGLTDKFAYIDQFVPAKFASLATYAFVNLSESWSLCFFKWQVPSLLLSFGKLFYRHHYYGAEKCKTKRVIGAILLQILTRAYISTFSIMLPQYELQILVVTIAYLIQVLTTQYILTETWPHPLEDIVAESTSASEAKTGLSTLDK